MHYICLNRYQWHNVKTDPKGVFPSHQCMAYPQYIMSDRCGSYLRDITILRMVRVLVLFSLFYGVMETAEQSGIEGICAHILIVVSNSSCRWLAHDLTTCATR